MIKKSFNIFLFSFILSTLFIFSCATLSKKDIPTEDERMTFKSPQVKLDYEPYGLRIDLYRQTRTETVHGHDSKGRPTTSTRTVSIPYHYIGVNLGNGIFLDANMNLSILVLPLLKIEHDENFKLIRTVHGFFQSKIFYQRKGKKGGIKTQGLFPSMTKFEFLKDRITFKGKFLSGPQDIYIKENEIVYDPHGIFGKWSVTKIQKTENGAKIPKFWNNVEIKLLEDQSVKFTNFFILKNTGKSLRLDLKSIFGGEIKGDYNLVRSSKGLVYFNKQNMGFVVDVTPTKVITRAGNNKVSFELVR